MKIDYASKDVLLIESGGSIRSAIVSMLRRLGVHNIKASPVSARVFLDLAENNYDIVLVGHGNREAYSGLQLLEEARHRGVISPSSVWLLMTDDSSQQAILHALENEPDDVITKPFSGDELKRRLDIILERKQRYRAIDDAVAEGDWEHALLICERDFYRDHSDHVTLTRAQMLVNLDHHAEAVELLTTAYEANPGREIAFAWAQIAVSMQQYESARTLLLELTRHFPLMISAYDLLAEVCATLGDLDGAIAALQSATERSPMAVPRHIKLGDMAVCQQNYQIADEAYSKSIVLGKHSCHRSASPYVKLANVKRIQQARLSGQQKRDLCENIELLLDAALAKFPQDYRLRVEATLLRAKLAEGVQPERAVQLVQAAKLYNSELDDPFELQRVQFDLFGDSLPILGQISPSQGAGAAGSPNRAKSIRLNNTGIEHYRVGDQIAALRNFSYAVEMDAENGAALLNLAQLFLEAARDSDQNRHERLQMAESYLSQAIKLSLQRRALNKAALLTSYLNEGIGVMPTEAIGNLLS